MIKLSRSSNKKKTRNSACKILKTTLITSLTRLMPRDCANQRTTNAGKLMLKLAAKMCLATSQSEEILIKSTTWMQSYF